MNKFQTNPQYEEVRRQLQSQTEALVNQRTHLQSRYQVESANITPVVQKQSRGGGNQRARQLTGLIQQIIKLSKQQNNLTKQEMGEIVNAERQILGYLQRQEGKGGSSQQQYGARQQQYGAKQYRTSDQQYESKLALGSTMQPEFELQQEPQNKFNMKEQIQSNTRVVLGDDTLEMIEAIEAKALRQIMILKNQKNQLLVKLEKYKKQTNEFHRGTNLQSLQFQRVVEENRLLKQQNYELRVRFDNLPQHNYPPQNQYQGQDYEGEFRNAQQTIKQLRNRIAHLPQMSDLYDQGEQIRNDTKHLIRIKSGAAIGTGSASGSGISPIKSDRGYVQELEARLQREQQQKQSFLNDLLAFKQKYKELQQENRAMKGISKHTFETENKMSYSPQRQTSSYNKSVIKRKNVGGFSQYEQTINQMRRVAQN